MTLKKRLILSLLSGMQALALAGSDLPLATKADLTGMVAATENVDNYTYVQIQAQGATNWYAVPSHSFTLGEEVIVPKGGVPMKDFHSTALDRTFDMVYFVGAITQVDAGQGDVLPPGHPPLDQAQAAIPEEIDFSDIERPEGGKTVAEIYEEQDALAGTSILVRGKVVKVANNILGTNWVHLRDGSGDAGSDDLTLTTQAMVTVGETVTVSGTLSLDRDFGSGYKYDVLLEDAELQDK